MAGSASISADLPSTTSRIRSLIPPPYRCLTQDRCLTQAGLRMTPSDTRGRTESQVQPWGIDRGAYIEEAAIACYHAGHSSEEDQAWSDSRSSPSTQQR